MTPVFQTHAGPEVGNCHQAAVASILGLPLYEIPNFGQQQDQEGAYLKFMRSLGFLVLKSPVVELGAKLDCYYLAFGPSIVTGNPHVAVYRAGKLSHDPHPGRNGLSEVESIHVLVPMEIDLG
jgi:hypothetical protein